MINVARTLFAQKGYADTGTEEIVRLARVTRGALYHQFRDKAALFEAVFDDVRNSSAQMIAEGMATATGDLWERTVVAGCRAYIRSVSDPSVARILHRDGPAVLDWSILHQHSPGLRIIEQALSQLMDAGYIEKRPVKPFARLFLGAFQEAGAYIAYADDVAVAQEEMVSGLTDVLNGLRTKPSGAAIENWTLTSRR